MPSRIAIDAPAKVNLTLAVHPLREGERLHDVDTVMAAVDLCDTVTVELDDSLDAPHVVCTPDLGIPEERNLAYRAALALGGALGIAPRASIGIEKRIPAEAGLGGGSSDAAATLKALCEFWGIDPADPRVLEVARRLGADVPFFLGPSPALMGGRGDVFVRAVTAPEGAIVIVLPEGPGISTPKAYRLFDELGPASHGDPTFFNDLEPAALRLQPALAEPLAWLRSRPGVRAAQVSGSGSALFALCADETTAERVAVGAKEIAKLVYTTVICNPSFRDTSRRAAE